MGGKNILFIHGLFGNEKTFGSLPENYHKKYNVYFYLYKGTENIWLCSSDLLDEQLKNKINKFDIIITHSQGGLILKDYLSIIDDQMLPKIVVFHGTPHFGSDWSITNLLNFSKKICQQIIKD